MPSTKHIASVDNAELARRLDRAGLWRGLSDQTRQQSIDAVATGTHPWATEFSEEVQFFADGEELAEGAVEGFLRQLAPRLGELGVEFTVRLVSAPESGTYSVAINDATIELYTPAVWHSTVETDQPWYSATVRPLAALNRLLAAAGVDDRLFTLYAGGNEGIVLLISPSVVDALRDSGLAQGKELPIEAV